MKTIEIYRHYFIWNTPLVLSMARQIEFELSARQGALCCCGRLATGFHAATCKKFQAKVIKATVQRLRKQYPDICPNPRCAKNVQHGQPGKTGKHDNRHDKRGEIEMTAGKDPQT